MPGHRLRASLGLVSATIPRACTGAGTQPPEKRCGTRARGAFGIISAATMATACAELLPAARHAAEEAEDATWPRVVFAPSRLPLAA